MLCVPAVWAAEPVSEVPPPHQSVVLDSAVMKEQRRINVYLPSTLQEERRYPVIYMPDGGLAEDFPHVANTIDAAIREGRMAPVILVGIENTQRRRDMTGPTTVKKDRKIAPETIMTQLARLMVEAAGNASSPPAISTRGAKLR